MKHTKKIIFILVLSVVFFKPFISHAALAVTTGGADNITDTETTLHGTASPDLSLNPKLPTTVYFRYSNTAIAPVFCNEIYGNNMISTKDIVLNSNGGAQPFFQKISNLLSSTTYHYCAIVSNKKSITYGAVNDFTTPPCSTCAQTTTTTNDVTNVGSTYAYLRGSYRSTEAVTTYFEYKKDTSWVFNPNAIYTQGSTLQAQNFSTSQNNNNSSNYLNQNPVALNTQIEPGLLNNPQNNTGPLNTVYNQNTAALNTQAAQALTAWTRVGDESKNANTFGGVSYSLTGLAPNTKYNFVFKAEKADGTQFTGNILSFKTAATDGGGGMNDTSVCADGWVGTYPNCIDTTGGGYNGGTGTGGTDNGGGTGNGGNGTGGNGTGTGTGGTTTTNTTTVLTIGTVATPPGDATVHAGEGIETVFARQIVANKNLAKLYGYQEGTNLQSFSWSLADFFAKVFGYVSASGKEVRVSQPDIAAYQIQIVANKITVYEYYNSKIINIQNLTSNLRNTYGYEYYFNKK